MQFSFASGGGAMADENPRALLEQGSMRRAQVTGVAVCVMLNALDGFDVLSIGFASPGIANDWKIERAALGVVLSMELIGMAFGSVIIGNLADRFGRRPTILSCLLVMAVGMMLAATASNMTTLSAYRFFTGLGIGGMLACTNAMVAELCSARRRALGVAIMAAGYPMGAVLGGLMSGWLLRTVSWHGIFVFGGLWTAAMLPLVWFLLPESVDWLTAKRPPDALVRLNKVLAKFGRTPIAALAPQVAQPGTSLATLFAPGLRATTLLMTSAYFGHVMTFYFVLKWTPKIVADMGFAPATAGNVLVWASFGGALGALSLSALTIWFDVRKLVLVGLFASAAAVTLFGTSGPDLAQLSIYAGLAGFCTNAVIVGLYAIVAQSYPANVRAGGTGFVIGIGRGGAALGPIVAGLLFAAGLSLFQVAALIACGSLIAACAIYRVRPTVQST
jgi:benzoate transport